MRNSNDGPDHHSNCAIQITHHDVILRTHGLKYRHLNDHSNCAFRIKFLIAHFFSRVKTVIVIALTTRSLTISAWRNYKLTSNLKPEALV